MKALRILLLIVFMAALSTTAMAVSVTINHGGGTLTGTLTSLSVNSSGGVTVNVTENLTGGGGGTTCTNTPPIISATNPPTAATTGTAVSATVSTSDANGNTVTVSASYGSVSGTTWSWTPSTAGTYTITLTASDGQNCNSTSSYNWTITVSAPSGGGGGIPTNATLIPAGDGLSSESIDSQATKYYYINLTNGVLYLLQVQMSTRDWRTDQDVYVGINSQPRCSDTCSNATGIYCNPTTDNNETVAVWKRLPAGSIVYVTVCNKSTTTGSYKLFYGGE